MSELTIQKTSVSERFEQFENSLPQDTNSIAHNKRKEALNNFLSVGFPKRKHEEYRYLDLSDLSIEDFQIAGKPDQTDDIPVEEFFIPNLKSNVLVFIDGHYSEQHSSIIDNGSFTIGTLKDIDDATMDQYFANYDFTDYNPFSSLNIAFAQNGGYIHIGQRKIVNHPIQILHLNTGKKWVQPSHLIIAEENAEAKIIESYFSLTEDGIDNTFIRIVANENAHLEHYKLQLIGKHAKHFGTTHIEQKRQSTCTTHVYNLGGGLVRNNIHIDIEDDHTEANMYGLYVTNGNDVVDNHTLVNHMKPSCQSNQLYKGVIDGNSKAVFNGKIFVQRDAQQTNAFQSNRNIVLSDDASINTKPQLEIWADDVKCSHGATIGKLSVDELFYLKSRGIQEEKAKAMLTYAFAGEVLTYIKIPELREFLQDGVAAKLGFEL